jgi:hypothetical protein
MLKERTITSIVGEQEYARLKRFSYKANWSTPDVEHFLFFSTYGNPRAFLTADFGVRNVDAQNFSVKSIQAYGGGAYHLVARDESNQCYMRFPLGKLAGWAPRWSLTFSKMSDGDLAELLTWAIREMLFPVIRDVTNLDRFISLLMCDEEPVRWVHVNGAMRMAQIAYLARRLGMGAIEIRSMLERRANKIRAHLGRGALDPAAYIDQVIVDSETAVLATKLDSNYFS